MTTNAFLRCAACDGNGFLRSPDFANRRFSLCTGCNGIGQIYVDPVKPPPVDRVASLAAPDCQPWLREKSYPWA